MSVEPLSSSAPQPVPPGYTRALKMLELFHYIAGGLTALMIPYGAVTALMGWSLLKSGGELPSVFVQAERILEPVYGDQLKDLHDPQNLPIVGAAFTAVGVVMVTLGVMHSGLLVYVGRCIARRRRWGFCVGFSIFDLTYLIPPVGFLLSVLALGILFRRSVRDEFKAAKSKAAEKSIARAANS